MGETTREFPLDFTPHCHQFEWMRKHLGGWQFGEQDLIPAILDVFDTDGCGNKIADHWACVEYGAGDGDMLPLTLDRILQRTPQRCFLIEIDDARRCMLKERHPRAIVQKSLNWKDLKRELMLLAVVVIDIDGPDSVVMREMLDAGCHPLLIVCEHMDRHYSIGTTLPMPVPEWLLGTVTEHGHSIQDTAETLQWIAGKYGYERIGFNRCNSFFVRSDWFPFLFRG